MQAANWPSPPRPNPFIPLSLQTAQQMPHASPEREWRFGETLLQQYRYACTTVHASYSRQVDGVTDLPSALLEGFEEQEMEEGAPVYPEWSRAREAAAREAVADNRAPRVSMEELASLHGGAALMEHQSHCPFRAFAQHRLEARALPGFTPGISNAERGQVVHEALRLLWSRFTGHGDLLAAAEDRCALLIAEAARVGMESIPQHRRIALGATCLELEQSRLQSLLREWVALEAQRGEFVVQAREENIVLELNQLVVQLRVDRVDELPDGSRVIIDYKTGKSSVSDWLGKRPPNPQLLLYGLAAPTPPAALAFGQVRPGECAYAGIGDIDTAAIEGVATDIPKVVGASMEGQDWRELNREWADILHALARDFIEGEATVDPLRQNSCTWCGLQSLCRISFDDSWEEDA
jgi:probable DNA repair protein